MSPRFIWVQDTFKLKPLLSRLHKNSLKRLGKLLNTEHESDTNAEARKFVAIAQAAFPTSKREQS